MKLFEFVLDPLIYLEMYQIKLLSGILLRIVYSRPFLSISISCLVGYVYEKV